MTPQDAANALNGNEYREEGSRELFAAMKEAGLVAVFGASDDLMEFRGAIYDEAGAGTVALGSHGILTSLCGEGEDCPYFKQIARTAPAITAHFDRDGFTFIYETAIPHVTFVINEEGEPYCRGIVFSMEDVAS